MDTIAAPKAEGRRQRRRHSPEFKAHVVAACCKPGVSMASVAMANGVNANLVRRWVIESEGPPSRLPRQLADPTGKALSPPPSFVPLGLPAPTPPVPADIRIDLTRGATTINVTWPVAAAAECATWMREVLR